MGSRDSNGRKKLEGGESIEGRRVSRDG
jgi:hypothetical protein